MNVVDTNQYGMGNTEAFAYTFLQKSPYRLVGATNEFEDVDVEKVFADMKKDIVLEQYKYFIGSPNMGRDEKGTVRPIYSGN